MRKTEKERQRKEKRGTVFCRETGRRSSVCKQHGVLHLTLPGYFLPKCCFFDQADITEKKTGMQTLRGGVNIGTQLTACHF